MPSKIRQMTQMRDNYTQAKWYIIPKLNYVPGFMIPGGIDIKNIKEKANVMEDNTSKRRPNHSIATAMLNSGREYLSTSFIFVSRNLDC
jgi:hypothetical protein